METFYNALRLANKFINAEVNSSPTHGAPLCEESYAIINELREYNRRGILTDNSQPLLYEVLKDRTLVQTPFVEGLCYGEMHDLMCRNADSKGYVYATIQMQNHDLKRSKPIIDVINLSIAYTHRYDTRQVYTCHPIYNKSMLEKHSENILESWNIRLNETQPLYYFIFAETNLPLDRESVKLARDNSFFTNLICA